jgi:hypothetical protein
MTRHHLPVAAALCLLIACSPSAPPAEPLTAVRITPQIILQTLPAPELSADECLGAALHHLPAGKGTRQATAEWLDGTTQSGPPDCRRLKSMCALAPLLRSHGLPEPGLLWRALCDSAARCDNLHQELRELQLQLARESFPDIYVRPSQETAGIRRYVEHLPQTAPETWSLFRRFLRSKRELSTLDCTAATYPGLVRHTAEVLLTGHPGADVYIAGQLARLPDDPAEAVKLFVPASAAYERLVEARRTYQAIVAGGGLGQAPEDLIGLKRGTRSRRTTVMLVARLAAEGFLPAPSTDDKGQTRTFDRAIEKALRRFQRLHMLSESGKVDGETLEALRIPAYEKLRAIDKALAAYRRAVGPWEPSFLFVQMPHAFLEAYFDSTFAGRFTTVIGSAATEKRANQESWQPFRTMPLNSAIESVTINPVWNVPNSIAVREIIPRLDKDPTYLTRNGFTIVPLSGEQIRYVQQPGPKNALGKFKFSFPNSWDIYLHDTPLKHYFKHRIRLHSHGCIRVRHARQLTALVLSRDQGTQWHELKKMVQSTDTVELPLNTPLPIHLAYSTAAADSDGNLYFMKDFYKLEK